MACTITVTSVIGVPAGPGFNPPGAVSAIIVTGTATNLASVVVNLFTAVQAPVTNGQWQITVAVPLVTPNTFAATCGETITFFVTDPTETECAAGWSQPLACPTCPTVTVDPPTIGDCAADGTRPVTLTVQINQPAGQSSAFQWDFGGGVFGPVFFVPPPPNPTQHSYAPGNPTATLKTVIPQGCADIPVQLSVPSCTCPQIQDITFTESDCDAGNRQVTATVTGRLGGTIFWQWSGQAQAHPGGTSDTATFPGGTTQTVTVVISQTGCPLVTLPKSHTLAACPIPPCPTVTNLTATPASGTSPLTVSFQATVNNATSIVPDQNGNLFHWSFGDSATQDTQQPTTSHTYTTTENVSACVTVNGPAGCNQSTLCTPISVGNSGPGNGGKTACGIARLGLALLFGLFFVGLAGWLCLSWPWWVPAGLGIAILALLIVWIIFCHPSICEVLLTIWQTLFVTTMALLYVAKCLNKVTTTRCQLLSLAWIGTAVLCVAIFLWWALRRSCDAGRCEILNAWLGATLDAAADLGIIYLVLTNANTVFPNCPVNGTVTAILPIISIILMVILRGGNCTIDPIRLGSATAAIQGNSQRPCC